MSGSGDERIQPRDFAVVASRASWVLYKYRRGKELSLEDRQRLEDGAKLLNQLEAAIRASERGDLEDEDYLSVREVFFVPRVRWGQPGYKEWSAAINKEFRGLLSGPNFLTTKEGLTEMHQSMEIDASVPLERLDKAKEFFATLSMWLMNNFPL